jgi:hypothetical protein
MGETMGFLQIFPSNLAENLVSGGERGGPPCPSGVAGVPKNLQKFMVGK